jgi:hypothetical protein
MVYASAFLVRLERGGELFCGLAELFAMRFVEWIARGQRPGELGEDLRQKAIVQTNHRLAPILTGTHEPDGDAVHVGVSDE